MNMLQTIVPKSDQLNADDLIGCTKTIKVTEVRFKQGDEQPVSIHFEGDSGKPYKVCKSMRRVLVQVWGPDANKYLGRSMTLYRDPDVKFGGLAVGGIRISHMSHLDKEVTIALTVTRASRKPFTVKPLQVSTATTDITQLLQDYRDCTDKATFDQLEEKRRALWDSLTKADKAQVKSVSDATATQFKNNGGDQGDAAPLYDAASAERALREATDIATLESIWTDVRDDYNNTKRDIPIAVEALRNELREQF